MKTIESSLFPPTEHGAPDQGRARHSIAVHEQSSASRPLDTRSLLINAKSLLHRAHSLAAGSKAEIFRRLSTRARVSFDPPETRPRSFSARDEGLAIRLDRGAEGFSFAACSGGGSAALDRAMSMALRTTPQGSPSDEDAWERSARGPMVDRERGATLPAVEELRSWLAEALALSRKAASRHGAILGPAWVEAGVTAEVLIADGGLMAVRTRTRVWALVMVRGHGSGPARERPRVVAARSLRALSPRTWAKGIETETPGREKGASPAVGALAVIGDAAATLVATLAATLHASGAHPPPNVGRAWRLSDDPLWVGGLASGRFDDAGFAARPLVLADGASVVGTLGTRGHYRRPSYRDIPAPMFTTLVLEGGEDPMPSKGFSAHDLRVHRLTPDRWVLDLLGTWLREGRPSASLDRLRLPVRPHDLVARCTRAIGTSRLHANGVSTPTLVFEGIHLRP